ncbi:FUSC family protein [Streptomyces hygroscopicus]|uniref:FUSC family protein n=1 Tax=Streptomyces hygroscopicus TaxID=1912 RepID=UPI0037A6AF82
MTTPATDAPSSAADAPASRPARRYAPPRVGGPRRWWDWVLASDPGLGHLQAGWRALVSMSVSLAAGYGMTRVLDVPAMLGMVVGGMMGLMSAFVVAENTPSRLVRASLWLPLPYAAVLPLASWAHQHRMLDLVLMVVGLAVTFFLARFGTFGLLTGMMTFNALMVGGIIVIPMDTCGPLAAIAVVASVAVLIARLLLCYPMPREDLLRTQRAFLVEARRIADAAATALDPDADRATAVRRMGRALRRLNITTVTIDGHLAQPEVAADPDSAELLHQYLFDAELALQGIGQAVQRMTAHQVPAALRETMVIGLVIARDTHLGRADALHPAAELIRQQATALPEGGSAEEAEVRALAHRVADLLDGLAESLAHWLELGWNSATVRARVPFQPTVALERNRPAGAGPAAERVAAAQARPGWRRAIPYLRAPLQAGTAAAITCPLADAINGQRFSWGLIGVLITLFGTNTTHERLRKLVHRVVGTAVGAVIGIALLHLIGPGHTGWTLVVIVGGLTIGSWGLQRQYAYWVVGLVVALVQMYGLTTPYGGMDRLLAQRLVDNALGCAVATVCAAVIFPVSTRKVAREVQRGYLSATEHLVEQVALRWTDPGAPVRLRGAARALDAALLQVHSVLRPLVRMPLGGRGRGRESSLRLLNSATRHARTLAASADIDLRLTPEQIALVQRVREVFTGSLQALDRRVARDEEGTWVRVSPVIRELMDRLPATAGPDAAQLRTALRELAALDEALAALAERRGLATTTPPAPRTTPSDRTRTALTAWAATLRPRTTAEAGSARAGATPATGTPGANGRPGTTAGPAAAPPAATGNTPRNTTGNTTGKATGAATGKATGNTAGTATVSGTLRCPAHPDGCAAWITVISDRGKREALVRAVGGGYRLTGLRPGGHTLIVSGPAHAPRAEFLLVDSPGQDQRHDITLVPAP